MVTSYELTRVNPSVAVVGKLVESLHRNQSLSVGRIDETCDTDSARLQLFVVDCDIIKT
jgi:hypothetical protein